VERIRLMEKESAELQRQAEALEAEIAELKEEGSVRIR
jgi:hypothetical protein